MMMVMMTQVYCNYLTNMKGPPPPAPRAPQQSDNAHLRPPQIAALSDNGRCSRAG